MTYQELVSENKNAFLIVRVLERDELNNPTDFELLAKNVVKSKAKALYESYKSALDDVLFFPVFDEKVLDYSITYSSQGGVGIEEFLTGKETAEFFRHYYGL